MNIKPWKKISTRKIIDDAWLTVRADTCLMENGTEIDPYYVIESNDWVNVYAFDEENRLVVNHQYRHATGEICYEIPCGGMEDGETPLEAAERELREETGFEAEDLVLIASNHVNPARYTNRVHQILATGVQKTAETQFDPHEEINSQLVPILELFSMIESGQFSQALHISGLYLILQRMGLLSLNLP